MGMGWGVGMRELGGSDGLSGHEFYDGMPRYGGARRFESFEWSISLVSRLRNWMLGISEKHKIHDSNLTGRHCRHGVDVGVSRYNRMKEHRYAR